MDNGQWTMDNGQWAMGNGQWAMGNGQLVGNVISFSIQGGERRGRQPCGRLGYSTG